MQDRRDRPKSRVVRVSPPCHEAGPERAVRYGGHWWRGLTNSGGLRPGRIQRPAAGTRSGGSGEEYSGRSRRWHHPWRGASVAPPPTFPLGDRRPPLPQVSAEHHDRTVKSGRCARLPTLSNPPAESVCCCRVPHGYPWLALVDDLSPPAALRDVIGLWRSDKGGGWRLDSAGGGC